MRRDTALLVGGLAAVAALSALVVVAVTGNRSQDRPDTGPPFVGSLGIGATATFSPRIALFGDTVRAYVDAVVDTSRVDPETVRVTADFAPWRLVGDAERSVRKADDMAHVRTTFVLRCLIGPCVVSGESSRLEFQPARVSFAPLGETPTGESAIRVSLPPLVMHPRFTAASLEAGPVRSVPWRADLTSLPPVSYRLAPGLLAGLLLTGAVLALVTAFGLAYVAWPRRAPPPPAPEPEPILELVLSPLEQALVLLEESVRVDGAEGQRRALELVAEELELVGWGEDDLARTARSLAWSEAVPPIEATSALAVRVRAVLVDESLHA